MLYTVVNKYAFQKVRGHDDEKIRYKLVDTEGRTLYALIWTCLNGKVVVYDEIDHEDVVKYTWSKYSVGYVYSHDVGYMHSFIAKLAGMDVPSGMSIDHINMCKLDNRRKNLRVASQSQQNANRGTRSDKLPPCQELVDQGINELPKYVRWDKTESKFVIEKHPALLDEVSQGKRKKAVMSGSKSSNISIMKKFQDILARLEELDFAFADGNDKDFAEQRRINKQEYDAICDCINRYEGKEVTPSETSQHLSIEPSRHTAAGKKTQIVLPDDCGVRHEDIPKYCYYKPASDKRGDKFVIDKHPAIVKEGKRTWSTTEKKTMSTYDKFQELLAKYNELNTA